MDKRAKEKLSWLSSFIFLIILLLFVNYGLTQDFKAPDPVPSTANILPATRVEVGKIATLPYADHISVYPLGTGDLVKGSDAYYFTTVVKGQYLFTLITDKGGLVTGELLTLTVGKAIAPTDSDLTKVSRQYKKELDLPDGSEVADWWKDYSVKILDENLRADEIGKETTDEAKTWPNDWKKWYNQMVPEITDAAEQRPIVTSEHWAKAYLEIWEGIK